MEVEDWRVKTDNNSDELEFDDDNVQLNVDQTAI